MSTYEAYSALNHAALEERNYLFGDEIPSEEVIQPKTQEKLGVLAILDTDEKEEKHEGADNTGAKKPRKKAHQDPAGAVETAEA